jgi:hypothetical protein
MKRISAILLLFLIGSNTVCAVNDDEAHATAAVVSEVLNRVTQENNLAIDVQALAKNESIDPSIRLSNILLAPQGFRFGGWFGARRYGEDSVIQLGGILGWRYTHAPLTNASFDVYVGGQDDGRVTVEPTLDFLLLRTPLRALFLEFTSGINAHIGYRYAYPIKRDNNNERDEHAVAVGISVGIVTHR